MGNRDWAQSIAEELGYYLDFVSYCICVCVLHSLTFWL